MKFRLDTNQNFYSIECQLKLEIYPTIQKHEARLHDQTEPHRHELLTS